MDELRIGEDGDISFKLEPLPYHYKKLPDGRYVVAKYETSEIAVCELEADGTVRELFAINIGNIEFNWFTTVPDDSRYILGSSNAATPHVIDLVERRLIRGDNLPRPYTMKMSLGPEETIVFCKSDISPAVSMHILVYSFSTGKFVFAAKHTLSGEGTAIADYLVWDKGSRFLWGLVGALLGSALKWIQVARSPWSHSKGQK